jgi:hypothetical protein
VAPDAGSRGSAGRRASGTGRGPRRVGEGPVAWAGRLGREVCSGKAPGAALGQRERGRGERIGGEGAGSRERRRQGEPAGGSARVWVAGPLVGLRLGVFFFYSKCYF